MNTKEFYQFLWQNTPDDILISPDAMAPVLTTSIIVNKSNIETLENCTGQFCEIEEDIEIGETVHLIRNIKHESDRGIYFNVKQALNHAFTDPEPVLSKNYYIASKNYDACEFSKKIPAEINALEMIIDMINILKTMSYYRHADSLIFFNKSTLEIADHLPPEEFNQTLIDKLNHDELIQKFKEFKNWIGSTDKEKGHHLQKKGIFSSQLEELLKEKSKKDRLGFLLNHIDTLMVHSMKSYQLYLDEFNYSKFLKKLEATTLDYQEKIRKSIADIRNQILALPVSYILINALKDNPSIYSLLGIVSYGVLLSFMIYQQKKYLDEIQAEISKFIGRYKYTVGIETDLSEMEKNLNDKIKYHTIVTYIFQGVVVLFLLFAAYQQNSVRCSLYQLLSALNSSC